MLKFLLKSKDSCTKEVLYQVSSDLGEVNSFYSSFFDAGQKAPLPFKSIKKPAWYRINHEGNKFYKSLFQAAALLTFSSCSDQIKVIPRKKPVTKSFSTKTFKKGICQRCFSEN